MVQLIGDVVESTLPQNLLVGVLQRHLLGQVPASRGSKDVEDRSRSCQEVNQVGRGVNSCFLGQRLLGSRSFLGQASPGSSCSALLTTLGGRLLLAFDGALLGHDL